ncbi:GHKL domain-containing protein [Mariniphaga anaerophila]|uniref:GHKL domain-containing protein n=1 Tax=Mariniphaga anaerophila TaxID=1484053 RepID=A0A1M4TM06_9BACT|nr:histidine kinase [Mariniphaga anaerophila]SHE45522.1 GHKL domain-containing protein [Mariniphaga anaerophila]
MNKSVAKYNWLPVILHILAWLVLIILPQIVIDRFWGNNNYVAWGFYANAAIYGIIFYINYLWLVPRFYFKGNKAAYFVLAVVAIVCLYFVSSAINQALHNPEREKEMLEAIQKLGKDTIPRPPFRQLHIYHYTLISIIITGFSIGLCVIQEHSATEKRQKEMEKEMLNSELAFLKNQISPHFFFNTLNNIYSLIEVNSNDAQAAVMKLSRMMRYLLYESEHGQTSLSHEIDFMNHYIDLMRLRLSPKVDLQVDLPEKELKTEIPPLLFIPFIENAFKHGVSYREHSFIHISMRAEQNQIVFKCSNSRSTKKEETPDRNHSGIGLENVKKRLNLLFPGEHELSISQSGTTFDVLLNINLKPAK